jgi:hypothetical protein
VLQRVSFGVKRASYEDSCRETVLKECETRRFGCEIYVPPCDQSPMGLSRLILPDRRYLDRMPLVSVLHAIVPDHIHI